MSHCEWQQHAADRDDDGGGMHSGSQFIVHSSEE